MVFYTSANNQIMARLRFLESPNSVLLLSHLKTHDKPCLGTFMFLYLLLFLKVNFCFWQYFLCSLMHILLLVFHEFPSLQISLESFLNLVEQVHTLSIKCNLTNICSYLLFYQSEGIVTKFTLSTRHIHQYNNSMYLFYAKSHCE